MKTTAPHVLQCLHSQADLTLHLRVWVHTAQVDPAVDSSGVRCNGLPAQRDLAYDVIVPHRVLVQHVEGQMVEIQGQVHGVFLPPEGAQAPPDGCCPGHDFVVHFHYAVGVTAPRHILGGQRPALHDADVQGAAFGHGAQPQTFRPGERPVSETGPRQGGRLHVTRSEPGTLSRSPRATCPKRAGSWTGGFRRRREDSDRGGGASLPGLYR